MRRALAIVALIGGALALVAGDPYTVVIPSVSEGPGRAGGAPPAPPGPSLTLGMTVQRLATAVAREEDHVTLVELSQWIRDRKPGLRLIDVRTPAEFAKGHFPRAENIPIESIPTAAFNPTDTIVLLSEGGAHAAQAWVFLQLRGLRSVYFLRDGTGGRRYEPGRDGC